MSTPKEEEGQEENNEREDSESEESSSEEDEAAKKAAHALTGRKVTLTMLMEDGIIEAGKGVLSIDYLGQKFEADLLQNGKIKWQGSQEEFGTPSAWALHCKRLVSTVKRSGCGWASVKYKSKKLDIWKSIWARKQRQSSLSKSPQTSPGAKLAASPGGASSDQPWTALGLASPTKPLKPGSTFNTPISPRLTSPTSTETSSSDKSGADSTKTTALATAGSSALESTKSSRENVEQKPNTDSNPKPPTQQDQGTAQQSTLSGESTSESNDPKVATSAENLANSASVDASLKPVPVTNIGGSNTIIEQVSTDGSAKPMLKADTSGTEISSLPKKAKTDDPTTFSVSLSRDLPSPIPGPLPPRAMLQQPTNRVLLPADMTLEDKGWASLQQQQLQAYHAQCRELGRKRHAVPYASLGPRALDADPCTLIKCEDFETLGKIQPFTVSITSNSLLLMDFHCHLTKSEVVGYLGGRWDCQRQHLSIEQAFPALCRLGDKVRSSPVEEEIRHTMIKKSLMVVGWYHSHPGCSPDPSIRDLDCQMAYQLRMRGSGAMYLPCVGFILSPFEKYPPKQDAQIQAFWVMPNLEHPTSFNIPMHVTYSIVRDLSLTEDLLAYMKKVCEFYSGAVDKVLLQEQWGEAITYLDKIKVSLRSKLPEDQLNSTTFLDYVQQLLADMK